MPPSIHRPTDGAHCPALPKYVVAKGTSEEPAGVIAAWTLGRLSVWVTRQIVQVCGNGCSEVSARVQALEWRPSASAWQRTAAPPTRARIYGATAISTGRSIALIGGSACLPAMVSCASAGAGIPLSAWSFNTKTDSWSPIPTDSVVGDPQSFAWTGRSIVAISPYLTPAGNVLGGYAAAFDPRTTSWATLPQLPVPAVPPTGPVLTGTVWTGTDLFASGFVLTPGHRSPPLALSTEERCPAITFPAFVGGSFCGPPPGPGNGNGPAGSCTGNETAPPCGPGMVAGRNYAYTLIGTCANDYIDGRWWANELPGGSTPVDVWVSVNGVRDQAGWMGPNGAVGFRPTTATSCT